MAGRPRLSGTRGASGPIAARPRYPFGVQARMIGLTPSLALGVILCLALLLGGTALAAG